MPIRFIWTTAQDAQIRRLRVEGASWDMISAVLGLSRWAVIERGRRIGAQLPSRQFIGPPDDPGREPLPAGHPRSWNVLTAGTVLENTPYPLPVFPR